MFFFYDTIDYIKIYTKKKIIKNNQIIESIVVISREATNNLLKNFSENRCSKKLCKILFFI